MDTLIYTDSVILYNPESVYEISFEDSIQLAGWGGYGLELSDDTLENGGAQSIQISGSCIAPHVTFELDANEEESCYYLTCMAKLLYGFGSIDIVYISGKSFEHFKNN